MGVKAEPENALVWRSKNANSRKSLADNELRLCYLTLFLGFRRRNFADLWSAYKTPANIGPNALFGAASWRFLPRSASRARLFGRFFAEKRIKISGVSPCRSTGYAGEAGKVGKIASNRSAQNRIFIKMPDLHKTPSNIGQKRGFAPSFFGEDRPKNSPARLREKKVCIFKKKNLSFCRAKTRIPKKERT